MRSTIWLVAAVPGHDSSPAAIQGRAGRSSLARIPSAGVQRSGRGGHNVYVTREERLREERFRAAFEEHYRAVARYLRTRGHASADADDLIAGTFEVAWQKIDRVPEGRDALPWLLGVARNLSRNARRKTQREASFLSELSAVTVASAEIPIVDRARTAEIMSALVQLRPLDRDLILLVAWDELTPSEAGQVLGLRAVTARSRLHRARQRLRALLEVSAAHAADTPPPSLPTSVSPLEGGRDR